MTYRERTGRIQDFDVKYRFFSAEEGGRETGPPYQGYRSDWAYDGDDVQETGVFMVWPEFEDDQAEVISEREQVLSSGIARMWIVSPEMIEKIHRARVKEGVKGYFMEGSKKVAEATIIRVVGLGANET